jgi:hypothetical protein
MLRFAPLFLAACTGSTVDGPVDTDPVTPIPSEPTADTGPFVDTDLPPELTGQAPANALPLPTFAATNFDGTSRGPEALQGHVTVLWFLPAANTGG